MESSHQHADKIFVVSAVSGGPYCNCNVNSGTETYAADLNSVW